MPLTAVKVLTPEIASEISKVPPQATFLILDANFDFKSAADVAGKAWPLRQTGACESWLTN